MALLGSVMKAVRVSALQTIGEFFIASEYSKSLALPALRPPKPNRFGPTHGPAPAVLSWQAWQTANSGGAADVWAWAADAATMTANSAPVGRNRRFIGV